MKYERNTRMIFIHRRRTQHLMVLLTRLYRCKNRRAFLGCMATYSIVVVVTVIDGLIEKREQTIERFPK